MKRFPIRFLLFIGSIFFAIGMIFFALKYSGNSFTILVHTHDDPWFNTNINKKLTKGKLLEGTFQAQENYLGTIQLNIDPVQKEIYDTLIFRIKSGDTKELIQQINFDTTRMSFEPSYSFGFPPIPDSKNKYYFFEIESTKGISEHAITFKNNPPRLITRYQYPRSLLLPDKKVFYDFLRIKTINMFTQPDFSTWMPFFFLPSLYFLIFLIKRNGIIPLSFLLIIATASYRNIYTVRDGIIILIPLALWLHLFITYRIDEKIIALISIALILIAPFMPFSAETGYNDIADRFTVLAYGFLIVLVIKLLYSLITNTKNLISTTQYSQLLIGTFVLRLITYSFMLFYWGITDMLYMVVLCFYLIKKYLAFFSDTFLFIFSQLKYNISYLRPRTLFGIFLVIAKLIGFLFFSFITVIVTISIAIGLVIFSLQTFIKLDRKIKAENLRQLRLSLDPEIRTIEPGIVYNSTKVVIYGNGFDQKAEGASMLKLLGPNNLRESVLIDFIGDKKIIFTVPLHWNTGQLYFWVETPITWQGKYITAKSNVVSVKLIPTITSFSPGFSPDDEAYFKQLEGLREETLRLNGHK